MTKWTDKNGIEQVVAQKWAKGYFLKHIIKEDDMFPLRIKLQGPTTAEISNHFSDMLQWVAHLRQYDKNTRGYGYILIEKEFHHRLCGKNIIPTHAEIPTLNDAIRLLGKQRELALFQKASGTLLARWECLRDWVWKKPFSLLSVAQDYPAIAQILHWFDTHDPHNLYLRQLDIEGVDTKFIETHRGLLAQLLDITLPAMRIQADKNEFEERYGLKSKPNLLRFRILDENIAPYGCTDISLPLEEFKQLQLPVKRYFLVENEINFLSFPPVPGACAIFGKGYSIDLLRHIPWLPQKKVFYWGDIDTHGLNILGIARGFLPRLHSFLMDEETLLAHRPLWVQEKKPFKGAFSHLTSDEYALACKLQSNHWGVHIRLEQERIPFSKVKDFVGNLQQMY